MGRRTDTIDIGRFWSKYVSFILDQFIGIKILLFFSVGIAWCWMDYWSIDSSWRDSFSESNLKHDLIKNKKNIDRTTYLEFNYVNPSY